MKFWTNLLNMSINIKQHDSNFKISLKWAAGLKPRKSKNWACHHDNASYISRQPWDSYFIIWQKFTRHYNALQLTYNPEYNYKKRPWANFIRRIKSNNIVLLYFHQIKILQLCNCNDWKIAQHFAARLHFLDKICSNCCYHTELTKRA